MRPGEPGRESRTLALSCMGSGDLSMLLGPDGKRYAKRDGSVTLMALREAGVTAVELRAELGF